MFTSSDGITWHYFYVLFSPCSGTSCATTHDECATTYPRVGIDYDYHGSTTSGLCSHQQRTTGLWKQQTVKRGQCVTLPVLSESLCTSSSLWLQTTRWRHKERCAPRKHIYHVWTYTGIYAHAYIYNIYIYIFASIHSMRTGVHVVIWINTMCAVVQFCSLKVSCCRETKFVIIIDSRDCR